MTPAHAIALFSAALFGGALNAVAGGGSFITFPTLILTGVPPIKANATNTVALWPGSVASVAAYRREVRTLPPALTLLLGSVSLVGGVFGALLLLHTPSRTFEHLIPYLLLIATLLFVLSDPLTRWRQIHNANGALRGQSKTPPWWSLAVITSAQLVIATYGGFFGGGIGILMLATLGLMGLENIHVMNGLKTILASIINGVAVVTFVVAGAVVWPQALLMLVGGIIGGYAGAAGARRLDPQLVRYFIILIGCAMTIYFFIRY
jgi:uncharacterized membrane protein YfcA